VSIQPTKSVFTEKEDIELTYAIKGIPPSLKPWVTVILASEPETAFYPGDWMDVAIDREGTITLRKQPHGDYQIRLFVIESGENILLGYCPITVKKAED
jgi:hypothetical protein